MDFYTRLRLSLVGGAGSLFDLWMESNASIRMCCSGGERSQSAHEHCCCCYLSEQAVDMYRRKESRCRRFPGTVHTPLLCTPPQSIINTTSRCHISTTMKAIDEAVVFLCSCDTPNVSEAARRSSVDRSTLSKRFSGRLAHKLRPTK
jgi:hypothetical protein